MHGTFPAGRSSFKILEWIFPSPSQSTTDPSRTTALNWNAWILPWSGGSLKAYIMSYHRPLLTELARAQWDMCPWPVLSPGTHGITGTLTPWCYAQTRDGMVAGGKCKPTHWQIAGDVYQKGGGRGEDTKFKVPFSGMWTDVQQAGSQPCAISAV